jgi:hypothetical protein
MLQEPVFAMDGMCYEKSAIEAWFELKGESSVDTTRTHTRTRNIWPCLSAWLWPPPHTQVP